MSKRLGVQYGLRRGHQPTITVDAPFLFLHIFKTAGASLRLHLEKTIDAQSRQEVYATNTPHDRLKRDRLDHVAEDHRDDRGDEADRTEEALLLWIIGLCMHQRSSA